MNKPEWDEDGQPLNLEAAAEDVLTWLQVLRFQPLRIWDDCVSVNAQRADRAIACLKRFLNGKGYRPSKIVSKIKITAADKAWHDYWALPREVRRKLNPPPAPQP